MSTLTIVLLVILIVLIIACVVLYFLGKRAEKKQAAQQEQTCEKARKEADDSFCHRNSTLSTESKQFCLTKYSLRPAGLKLVTNLEKIEIFEKI